MYGIKKIMVGEDIVLRVQNQAIIFFVGDGVEVGLLLGRRTCKL